MVKTEARESVHTPGSTLFGIYIAALGSSLIGNLLIRVGAEGGWFGPGARAAIGVIVSVPLIVAAFYFWRLLRHELDEMLQRVVLEGMSAALVLYVPLAALYVNLRTAGVYMPRLDPPELLLTPALLVALGIAIASKRYR